jgi:Xaa-Pro dipeptidase
MAKQKKIEIKYTPSLPFGDSPVREGIGIDVARMRVERTAKVKALMKKRGIPTLLATGEPNIRFLTGFKYEEFTRALGYCLFFVDDDPVVFAPAGSFQQMPDMMPWIKNWRIARSWLDEICGHAAACNEASTFAKEIFQELKKRGLTKEKVGTALLDELAKDSLRQVGLNVVDGLELLLDASATKTPDEINCLKMVASMCSVGFQRIIDVTKPGMTDSQVTGAVMAAMAEVGSEEVHAGVMSGPMAFQRTLTRLPRRIEYGDMMYSNLCGNSYMGYHSCLYRQFIVGRKPTPKQQSWYDAVKDRIDRAIDASRIGNTTADVAKVLDPVSRWGYKDEAEVLTIEFGHGLGLVTPSSPGMHYNYPVINRLWSLKYPQPLEEGMVIAYEMADGEHRVGGARLEDTIVITKNGPEVIDFFPRDEIIVI